MYFTTTHLHHKYFLPWGNYEFLEIGEDHRIKKLTISKDKATSYHNHRNREEYFTIISGNGKVVIGESEKEVGPGDTFCVPKGVNHAIHGGCTGLTIVEVQTGECDELDEDRVMDKYGRHVGYQKDLAEKIPDKILLKQEKEELASL